MHLYVPDTIAQIIRRQAKERGLPVSKYLAEIVRREISDSWEDSFFEEVVGGWIGKLERPVELELTPRDELFEE